MNKVASESQEEMSLSSGMSVSDIEMEVSRTPEPSSDPDPDLLPRRLSFSKETPTADGGTKGQQNEQKQATPPADDLAVPAAAEAVADVTYVARCVAVEEEQVGADERDGGVVDSGLEEALGAVVSSLDDYRGQFPELQLLEDELKLLQVTLKVRFLQVAQLPSTCSCSSPASSLTRSHDSLTNVHEADLTVVLFCCVWTPTGGGTQSRHQHGQPDRGNGSGQLRLPQRVRLGGGRGGKPPQTSQQQAGADTHATLAPAP